MVCKYKRGKTHWLKWYQDGKARYQSTGTSDIKVANYLKHKKEIELAEKRAGLPSKNKLVQECLDEYVKATKHQKTAKVSREEKSRIQAFLNWSKPQKISQIKAKVIEDYINYRFEKDSIKRETANHIIANIKTWLNWCVKQRYILENPASQIKKFKLYKNPPRFLNEEEIERLLNTAKETELYSMIATAIYAGLRAKELMYLEWSDIDFKKDIIQVINKDNFSTKSRKFRIVPLHKKLRTILESYKKDSGWCFTNEGKQWQYPPRKSFKTILRKAGIKNIGWHSLRKTFASQAAIKNISLLKISKWLGHSDPRITFQTYAHLSPSDEDINRI